MRVLDILQRDCLLFSFHTLARFQMNICRECVHSDKKIITIFIMDNWSAKPRRSLEAIKHVRVLDSRTFDSLKRLKFLLNLPAFT